MKKIICLVIILFVICLIFSISINKTSYASRGCCSWHGGVSYCGSNGYYICNDGTQSPSCRCSSTSLEDNNNDNHYLDLYDSSCNYSDYENEIKELKEKNEDLEEKNNDYLGYIEFLIFILFIGSIYCYYKIRNLKNTE